MLICPNCKDLTVVPAGQDDWGCISESCGWVGPRSETIPACDICGRHYQESPCEDCMADLEYNALERQYNRGKISCKAYIEDRDKLDVQYGRESTWDPGGGGSYD